MPEFFSRIEVSYARRILAAHGVPTRRRCADWLVNPETDKLIAFVDEGLFSDTLFDRFHSDRVRVAATPTEIVSAASILLLVIAAHDSDWKPIQPDCIGRTRATREVLAQAQAKLESLGIDVTTV